tara:strand:+ start:2114 stop:2266 length:153 start_codon:yes stop_codon:yes gene_type:complete
MHATEWTFIFLFVREISGRACYIYPGYIYLNIYQESVYIVKSSKQKKGCI